MTRAGEPKTFEATATYEEQASAAKSRPAFARMISDAYRGMFDVLVEWALDRFGRSLHGNMQAVLELDRCGVKVVSVRERWLDTEGAVRPLLIAIFSWVAPVAIAVAVERDPMRVLHIATRGPATSDPVQPAAHHWP